MKTVSVRIQRLAALAGLAACAALSANANVFITDENTFRSYLLPGYYLEDFDGYTAGTYTGDSLTLSGGSQPVSGDPWVYTIRPDPGGLEPNGNARTLYSGDSAMSVSYGADALKVTFESGSVTAVGGFFYPTDPNGAYTLRSIVLELNNGTSEIFEPSGTADFSGFISPDIPISSITMTVVQQGQDYAFATMDHFYVGGAVPEPVGVATMTGVVLLGGAGLMRWRKRL
ncbi:MAG: hypothetical protein KA118_18605 [Verrucomicrobia bacterium]|nr:hypothetical protein [Verrucomicrobiota bacterium]